MLKQGKIYKTDINFLLYSNIDTTPEAHCDKLKNKSFIFLEKIKSYEKDRFTFIYKILLEDKIFYLWVNENNFEAYQFELV